ncbi:MAG: hypothetical protein U0T84_08865 [Chitinophagales bacterium]
MKSILCALWTAVSLGALAQGSFVPLGTDAYHYVDRMDIKYGRILPTLHTGTKPFLRGEVAHMAEALHYSNLKQSKKSKFQIQYLMDENAEWLDSAVSKTRKPLFRALYKEPASFFSVYSKKKGLFDLHVNPVLSVFIGGDSYKNRFIFNRAIGVEFRFNIKKVLSAYVYTTGNSERNPYYANQLSIPGAMSPYAFVPGNSYYKIYSSKYFKFNDGLDYFDARGYINLNVLDYLNITFGRDKHFWGNGQRSLFHSDFSAPALFLQYKLSFWRLEYVYLLEQLTSNYLGAGSTGNDRLFPKKYGVFHHLNIKLTRWFDFGLFEGVMAKRGNNFDAQYLNPIIFYRSVEHALGSPDNVLVGADFKINAFNHMQFYGQVVVDEFNFKNMIARNGWWANKYGFQLGIKYIDLAPHLDLQAEFNLVRPFTYTHPGEISFTNYNQPLAHPLGANFYEFILAARYQPIPRLLMEAKFLTARTGTDTAMMVSGQPVLTNYGGDLSRIDGPTREYQNTIGQGNKTWITYFSLNTSYQPWHNIYLDLTLTYRNASAGTTVNPYPAGYGPHASSSFFVTVGARMNITRRKFEF